MSQPAEGPPPPAVKPLLRGMIHQWTFTVSLVTGSVLCMLARGPRALAATIVYSASVTLLFGTSALYHRVTWGVGARRLMKRLDHAMIFVLIAGTYTPFALLVLPHRTAVVLLTVVWSGAAVGVVTRMAWLTAPRWAILPLYLGLGWLAVLVMPDLLHKAGVVTLVLLLVGGAFYTVGALAYASRRPNPKPSVFGYHEVFHACTLVAFVCHYVAVFFALSAAVALA